MAQSCLQPGGRVCLFWVQQKAAHFTADRAMLSNSSFIFSKVMFGDSTCLSLVLHSHLDQNVGGDTRVPFISSSWHTALVIHLRPQDLAHFTRLILLGCFWWQTTDVPTKSSLNNKGAVLSHGKNSAGRSLCQPPTLDSFPSSNGGLVLGHLSHHDVFPYGGKDVRS